MPSAYRIEGNVLDLNCLFAIGINMGILAVKLKKHFKHRETKKTTIKKVNLLIEKDIYDRPLIRSDLLPHRIEIFPISYVQLGQLVSSQLDKSPTL